MSGKAGHLREGNGRVLSKLHVCKWLVRAEVPSGQNFLVLALSPLVTEEGTNRFVYSHPTHAAFRKVKCAVLFHRAYFLLSFKYSVFFKYVVIKKNTRHYVQSLSQKFVAIEF